MQELTIIVLGGRPDKEVQLCQALDLGVGPVETGIGQGQLYLLRSVVGVQGSVQLHEN